MPRIGFTGFEFHSESTAKGVAKVPKLIVVDDAVTAVFETSELDGVSGAFKFAAVLSLETFSAPPPPQPDSIQVKIVAKNMTVLRLVNLISGMYFIWPYPI